ncbi:DUF4019 domain-containing protein [Qipengyuania sp. MTN3-11]|uniref:helix-turn-helix domain-containing protein n=1 Tax=Qipengyuania sp. MTN3-11 TaxID=3056557 RepID=UPI0036F3AAF5
MTDGYRALTEKEKETLRLILHGHDAKSMAAALDLSVHTINERLRNARRKLGVTSSKEAARMLFERERDAPQFLGHKGLGDADPTFGNDREPTNGRMVRASLIAGVFIMSIVLAILAFGLEPALDGPAAVSSEKRDDEAEIAAREFLELIDASDWSASYARTASAFRGANTEAVWSDVSREVRGRTGVMLRRKLLSVETPPAPQGYVVTKFSTDFAREKGLTETVSLIREDGAWRIAGIYVE